MTILIIGGCLLVAFVLYVYAASTFAESDKGHKFIRQEYAVQQPGRRLDELAYEWKRRGNKGTPPGTLKNLYLQSNPAEGASAFLDRHGM